MKRIAEALILESSMAFELEYERFYYQYNIFVEVPKFDEESQYLGFVSTFHITFVSIMYSELIHEYEMPVLVRTNPPIIL